VADVRALCRAIESTVREKGATPLPFAVFDEFGKSCDDRVQDHFAGTVREKGGDFHEAFIDARRAGQFPVDERSFRAGWNAAPGAVREKGGGACTEDFCGVDQECRAEETRSGTQYRVCKWTCPKCGNACSMLEIDDEWCHGDSLCISHTDGKRVISCGRCWLAASPSVAGMPAADWVAKPESRKVYAAPSVAPTEFPDEHELEQWRSTADDLLHSISYPGGSLVRRAAHLLQNAYLFASKLVHPAASSPAPSGWIHTTPEYPEYVQERLDPASFDPAEKSSAPSGSDTPSRLA
jgi:hypothetical protein